MPRRRAVAFIRATNAAWLPASHRASIHATLSAEGSSSASSAWRGVSLSPAHRGAGASPSRTCDGYAAASDDWTAISGPEPPEGSGWSCRITYAVITLATLAIATGRVAPGPATTPKPLMSAAETPCARQEPPPSRSGRGAAGTAVGVTVPEGGVAGSEGAVSSSARANPARQASAASRARIPLRRRYPIRAGAGPCADRVLVVCIPATVRHRFRRHVRLGSQPCHSKPRGLL